MEIDKARLSLQGARLCFEGKCYDSSASRSYYAMFQAAQVALDQAGFGRREWTHAGLQASFASQLIQRKKIYPPRLAQQLNQALRWRLVADYSSTGISQRQAAELLRWAEDFVCRVEEVIQGV
ncbi:MAG: HEPN domain-containing protein [Candidatus Tectomicrobia bacterium]|uniref:HEPN domain-containing protein n=1 Tax=Tectimicrobiota bacterium TaxID=2528274 RepID=A0A932FXF4_UNCTE|nr:HEPN domain-containing protein [Candidatus Tectomicrobia bacterium]